MDTLESQSSHRAPFQSSTISQPSEDQIVQMLNNLMKALCLPIPIISPTDLTPSLLFAILESLLGQKLPVPSGSKHQDYSMLKVQKVKLFLGVLETDILQEDVGFSKIDPRKLAAGEWHEAFFVAKVLCMVGQRLGLLRLTNPEKKTALSPGKPLRKVSDASTRPPRSPPHSRYPTPEVDTTSVFYAPSSTATRDTQITMVSLFDEDSFGNESISTTPDLLSTKTPPKSSYRPDLDTPSSVALSLLPAFQSPPLRSAAPSSRTNDTPSLLLSVDDHHSSTSSLLTRRPHISQNSNSSTPVSADLDLSIYPRKVPVRYSGYIERVDEDIEIASYEHSRSFSSPSSSDSMGNQSILRNLDALELENSDENKTTRTIAAIQEEYERTLKLLDERAQLLQELADLNKRETV